MANFVFDTFTDTGGTALESHVGETGATWTKHASYSAGGMVISNANRARLSVASQDALYYASGTPASADYSVTVTINRLATPNADQYPAPCGRIDTSANTFYRAQFNDNSVSPGLRIYKTVAGSTTQLGSTYSGFTPTTGVDFTVSLTMTGTTISAGINGTDQITTTDSAISAAGKAGLTDFAGASDLGNTVGDQFSDITAADGSASGGGVWLWKA